MRDRGTSHQPGALPQKSQTGKEDAYSDHRSGEPSQPIIGKGGIEPGPACRQEGQCGEVDPVSHQEGGMRPLKAIDDPAKKEEGEKQIKKKETSEGTVGMIEDQSDQAQNRHDRIGDKTNERPNAVMGNKIGQHLKRQILS